jgi:hypothetical protein
MPSGSVNVISITFSDFTLPSHFHKLFEALTVTPKLAAGRFQQPIVPKALHQSSR